jgi:PTS system fructose-specific IIA component/PTS system nitrogen regulatory IIA component
MKLRGIVAEAAILPRLAATSRDEALAALMGGLVDAGIVRPERREEFLKAVIARERKGSTGVGQGVAIPHVKTPHAKSISAAIGVSAAGLDFSALDRQPVHIVFLVISPVDRPEEHIDAMHLIVTTLGQAQFRRFLRQASTVQDVVTLLEEADSNQPVR